MRSIEQTISIGYHYAVHFTAGMLDPANPLLVQSLNNASGERTRRILFVIDANVARLHPALSHRIGDYSGAHGLDRAGEALLIPGGETAKNDPTHLQTVYHAIHERGICRHSCVVAIGGGAVLDVVGYAAATAHRGTKLIRVPTTVLAQNDSGIGVKTSVNAFGKKNFIGAFAPPNAVINDWDFLITLEQRDWVAGISEAVKVALIKDSSFFQWIEVNAAALVGRTMSTMQQLIHHCAELHLQHIARSGDPFESGSARPLDFGHWAAHKLEQMSDFSLRHGEAVAIGIALDVMYSHLIGSISREDSARVQGCLRALTLPTFHPAMCKTDILLEGLQEFREHLGGDLTITLLRGLGDGHEVHEIDRNAMIEAVRLLAESR